MCDYTALEFLDRVNSMKSDYFLTRSQTAKIFQGQDKNPPEAFILKRAEGEEEEAQKEKQQAGLGECGVTGWRQFAILIRVEA